MGCHAMARAIVILAAVLLLSASPSSMLGQVEKKESKNRGSRLKEETSSGLTNSP